MPAHNHGLRTAGLFSGIGGLELGLSAAGHPTRLLCEIDPAARAVLKQRCDARELHDDVRSLAQLPRGIELLVGGFPCQDLSQAGRTLGIGGARSGLVLEVLRLLSARRVPWLVLENVPFMLQLAKGRALEVIVSELERLGYRWAYRVVDTRAFGLPQRRRRVLIVAAQEGDPRGVLFADDAGEPPLGSAAGRACGFYWTEGIRGLGWAVDAVPTLKGGSSVGVPSPPAIWLPDGRIVTPDVRDAERLQGFDADWTRPAEMVARPSCRWKLIGNAVSVPVARWLGQRLAQPGDILPLSVRALSPESSWPRAAFNIGEGRFEIDISEWPRQDAQPLLHEFLQYEPKLLSAKATAGFLLRTQKAKLRFPNGLIPALKRHLTEVQHPAR